ncbi:MAG: 16S rRNA (adenine(1518)-N(6)/adenine(1519)-N(6))-dimethyltransferase RsmA [Deltaproteobacteria bacterium]|nr:16S rRNA (adenine(1518)-N(6)/adenine(1519)-N(6))-dimethyltransferase RsmA [Deltaproteobacteria bacterium]
MKSTAGSGSAAAAREFLQRHGLAPHRERGQNFLWDEQLAAKLVRLAGVRAEDAVLEVGTGLGILTRALAAQARRVATLEVDAGLVRALRAESALPREVALHHADALEQDLAGLAAALGPPVRVVANLPFSAAAPLLRVFLGMAPLLEGWGVTVQREMAARIGAAPGERGYGSLAVLHAWLARPGPRLDLHPRCFYPVPRVTSTFLTLTPRPPAPSAGHAEPHTSPPSAAPRAGPPSAAELPRLEALLRAGFAHRRKTLANSLAHAAGLNPAEVRRRLAQHGLPPAARAQQLSPATWLSLARTIPG